MPARRVNAAILSFGLIWALAAAPFAAAAPPKRPGSAARQACLDMHKNCVNKCLADADLSDPNCAIRCRQAFDRCNKPPKTRA